MAAETPTANAPSFAALRGTRPRAGKWIWLGIGVLIVTLVAMLLVAGRNTLASDARTRPLAERTCAWLGCTLTPWQDLQAFRLLESDMHADPALPGALRVQAGFINDAPWPQAWPALVLTLSDANGQPLARRALAPADYLDGQHPALIGAGQTASVQFTVREPARAAVAFHFTFQPLASPAR
ncbi:MAG: DUF3426 domain-containing protein [Xanthomonadaceae bacterium]|nr:DUF3426 domain-containing protein [Xanthomonadaceae bacterium]